MFRVFPYTGCSQNGTAIGAGDDSRALGSREWSASTEPAQRHRRRSTTIVDSLNQAAVNWRPIYGISHIFVVATEAEVSTDARLSALSVNDGTSDLTLMPSFAPGTTAYAADVGLPRSPR